ncbi:MAG: hypothetical protein MAG795_01223 [Candidatus Woesearchaeota archaeon]|nr:hypothetical protein [Candidatus Woesearchaeota archaeon]
MSKKAQGLSLNTIVIAAIVILVLFVLIMVFTGRMSWFTEMFQTHTEKDCNSYGGNWQDSCEDGQTRVLVVTDGNEHPGQMCCKDKEAELKV